ncbi:MAG: MarR family winged helix-turn-helix transcriptional regulator [Niabella sp.]
MKYSSFNLTEQNQKIESKIVVALERISEAFRVLLWNESKENALSPIQIQILIFIYFHSVEKCKVGYLADEFNMTKATISDSVRVLLEKDLIAKEPDSFDTRSYTLSLTPTGKSLAKKASGFAASIERPVGNLSIEQKTVMLHGLLQLINNLNKTGVITVQRMCFTCSNYLFEDGAHYCKLLKSKLVDKDLRIDCPDHELIA